MSKSKHAHIKNTSNVALKMLGLLLLVAVLCFGCLAVWRTFHGTDNNNPDTSDDTEVLADNSETPSDIVGDTTEGDDNKTEATNADNNRQDIKTDKNGLKVASIQLATDYADGLLSAHGTITNIVEDGGTCTYVFNGPNGKVVSEKVSTITDFHGTLCQAVEMTKEELGSGSWSVILKYKSNSAEGESEAEVISVQ